VKSFWKLIEKSLRMLNEELNNLTWEYVQQIAQELEQVKRWELDKCIFWFDISFVWVYQKWKWYYGEKYPDSEVTITYSEDKYLITDLKIEDILKMMKDWKEYIDKWEKQTGMKKI
jgi:hypothetical protein